MSNNDRRSEWTVLVGIGLVVLGVWLFLNTFFGWMVAPIAAIISVASRVIWPLLVIGLGVLLILRARGGGWAPSGRKLYRSREDRMVAGVLAGFAKWLGVAVTPLRVVYVILTFLTGFGPGVLAYVIAAIVLPESPFATAEGYTPPTPPPVPGPVAPPAPPVSTPPAPPVTVEPEAEPPAPPVAVEPAAEPPAPPAAPAPADEQSAPPAAPPVPPTPPAPPAS